MKVRVYEEKDRCAVLDLSERLADIEMPRIGNSEFAKKQRGWLSEELDSQSNEQYRWVVVTESDKVCGFLEVFEETDWFTDQKQAYLSRICLDKEIEGKGQGKRLMKLAEEWALEQGYAGIALTVIAANQHAVDFYRTLGYETETMKMRKPLK